MLPSSTYQPCMNGTSGKTLLNDGNGAQTFEKLLDKHPLEEWDISEGQRFIQLFADISLIINAKLPGEVSKALRDNEIMAIPKNAADDDVRPIGIGSTLRKVASAVFRKMFEFNEKYYKHFQHGLKSNGTERIGHEVRIARDMHKDWDFYSVDGDNGFNRSNRIRGMQEVLKLVPSAYPFLREMYLCIPKGGTMD